MCDHILRTESVDLAEIMPGSWGPTTYNVYCQRASQFWVQSLLSTHNSHACAHHLARIVRDIEAEAKKFDLCAVNPPNTEGPDMRYARTEGPEGKLSSRVTRESSNWARVTVKPYTPRAQRSN